MTRGLTLMKPFLTLSVPIILKRASLILHSSLLPSPVSALFISAHCLLQVDYRTEDGTANAGSDYEFAEGTLLFKPGENLKGKKHL